MQIRCAAPKQDVVGKLIMAQSPIGASAGLSSTTREPSMEEILASIRRIIEESDTVRPDEAPPPAVNSDLPRQPVSDVPHRDDLYGREDDGEEAELAPRQGIAVTPPVQVKPQPVLPDPLPAGREEPEAILPEAEPVMGTVVSATPLEVSAPPAAKADKQPAEGPEFEQTQREAAADAGLDVPDSDSDPFEPEVAALPESAAIGELEAAMEYEVSPEPAREPDRILSENTGRQVSAAFEDLSFAVRNEPRHSFDEIAQEIMRPLLQDWLDNNLPGLVERLVREEIERVVRGGKR
jgi:uncharacterized protein